MRAFLSATVAICFLSTGCTTVVKQTVPFNEADFEPYVGEGTSTILGTAYMRNRSGEVEAAAAQLIELIPVTPYTQERFEFALDPSKRLEPRDLRLDRHIRRMVADGEGRFAFRSIPAGDYFVVCTLTFDVAASRYGAVQSSRRAVAKMHVEENQTKRLVLREGEGDSGRETHLPVGDANLLQTSRSIT